MKIITIIGARPQFIKASMLSKIINQRHNELIIHTGQHYDKNMSDIFFNELNIPKPAYNLNIGSGAHGHQTGRMIEEIENILLLERPDKVLVYGDTNSTLAGALAAAKMHIPVIHVEAGLRSFNKFMPEEINRVLTDHISNLLFCPTEIDVANLKNENITENVYCVGDIMKDSVLFYANIAREKRFTDWVNENHNKYDDLYRITEGYYLATVHRAENTDDVEKLSLIFSSFSLLPYPVVVSLHPRTKKAILVNDIKIYNTIMIEPVGYIEMLFLQINSIGIITDSGGIQKEAYILKKPCVTLRNETEWTETLNNGCNRLANININDIVEKIYQMKSVSDKDFLDLYGFGNTAQIITDIIDKEI